MQVVVIDDAQVNLVLMSALLGKLPDCDATCFLSPAEALRRSMVALLDDTSDVRNAYPETWAPFVIVGTGGRLAN